MAKCKMKMKIINLHQLVKNWYETDRKKWGLPYDVKEYYSFACNSDANQNRPQSVSST